MAYKCTRAKPKHLVEVLTLVNEVNDESYGELDDGSWETNGWRESFVDLLTQKIEDNTGIVVIVEDGETGEIVSCGICTILQDVPSPWNVKGQYGFVRSMSTKLTHRGQGLGTLVIDEIKVWAQEVDLSSLRLNTSDDAESFYERAGFEIFPYQAMALWFSDKA